MKITVRIAVYKYEINVLFPKYVLSSSQSSLRMFWRCTYMVIFIIIYIYMTISSFNPGQSSYNFLYMLFIYHMNQLLLLLNDICKWNADCQFQLYVREFSDYVHCSGRRSCVRRETFRLPLSYDNESTCTRSTKNLKLIEESNSTSNYRTMYYCEYLPNTAAPLNDICQWNGNCQLQSFLVSGEKEGKV